MKESSIVSLRRHSLMNNLLLFSTAKSGQSAVSTCGKWETPLLKVEDGLKNAGQSSLSFLLSNDGLRTVSSQKNATKPIAGVCTPSDAISTFGRNICRSAVTKPSNNRINQLEEQREEATSRTANYGQKHRPVHSTFSNQSTQSSGTEHSVKSISMSSQLSSESGHTGTTVTYLSEGSQIPSDSFQNAQSNTKSISSSRPEIHYPNIYTPAKCYLNKRKRKLIRLMTVLAYVFSVSLVAILLSLYYLFIWNPYTRSIGNLTKTYINSEIYLIERTNYYDIDMSNNPNNIGESVESNTLEYTNHPLAADIPVNDQPFALSLKSLDQDLANHQPSVNPTTMALLNSVTSPKPVLTSTIAINTTMYYVDDNVTKSVVNSTLNNNKNNNNNNTIIILTKRNLR